MTFVSRHHVPNADLTRSPADPRYVKPVEEAQAVVEPKEEPKAAPKKKAKK